MAKKKYVGRPPTLNPDFRRIGNELRKLITSGLWVDGQVVPSRQSLARKYKVGRQTIRMAIDVLKQENRIVTNAHRRLIIKNPVGGLTGTKGVILEVATRNLGSIMKGDEYHEIQRGILLGAGDLKKPLYIAHAIPLRECLPPDLLDLPLSGIVIVGNLRPAVLKQYEKLSIPVVWVDRPKDKWKVRYVAVDNEHAAYDATRRILARGHRRIGFLRLAAEGHRGIDPDAKEREAGFQRALKEAGLDRKKQTVVTLTSRATGNSSTLQAILNAKPKITAVLSAGAGMVRPLLEAAVLQGRKIPDDLFVTSFQGTSGSLRGVPGPQIDFVEMGRCAVNFLAEAKPSTQEVRLPAAWKNA